jgi:hypothetical protein
LLSAELFAAAGLRLEDLVLTPSLAVALLAPPAATADCPRCGTPSDRVHSRYRRPVADLPLPGRRLALRLAVRRFRGVRPDCPGTSSGSASPGCYGPGPAAPRD